jgi:hypothetical protein
MKRPPIIFLLGPPGAGKATLGSRVCKELGLAFLDLAEADWERLCRVVSDTSADVIELPWAPSTSGGRWPWCAGRVRRSCGGHTPRTCKHAAVATSPCSRQCRGS